MSGIIVIGSRNSGNKNNPNVIADAFIADGVETRLVYWEDLVFKISAQSIQITVDSEDIFANKPDLVIAVGWYKSKQAMFKDVAFSLALYMQKNGIKFWNSEMASQRSTSKLSCMMQLSLEDIEVPTTYFSLDTSKIMNILEKPFIAKAAAASRGEHNYLVKTDDDIDTVYADNARFIVQPFIENDHDLRVICFNGIPSLALRRSRAPNVNTHLNNTSQGGNAVWIDIADINPKILTISRKICIIMKREMAGIDFIADSSSVNGYKCLEVNAVPQLTSGVDSYKKLLAFSYAVRNFEGERT